MDPYTWGGMVFSIIVLAMIGGFVLLLPITRQLGAVLRNHLESGGPDSGPMREEMLRLAEAVSALEEQVRTLGERQEFTERLLDKGDRSRPVAPPTD